MTHSEERKFLIEYLLMERGEMNIELPEDEMESWRLLRSLMNIRKPMPISKEFLSIQDHFLQEEIRMKGITELSEIPFADNIGPWQGDITAIRADSIVNAANSAMTGCYHPCHGCIDNEIHTYAGVQLRLECAQIMERQGHEEETGKAKITKAYNLPSHHVIHTVGPIVYGNLRKIDEELLASCYDSCLSIADSECLSSIVFCCISTGEFRFPPKRAAEIAIGTVRNYLKTTGSGIKVVFNVFKDSDMEIYRRLLG